MQEFLFNPSMWMPVAAAIVAIALFIYGNSRLQAAIRNTGLGIVGLVICWCVAAFFVQTPVEQCVARTKAIVRAVEAADWPTLTNLLDKTTSLEFLHGRDAIAGATQTAAQSYQLKDIRILSTTPIEGAGGTVDVTLTSLLEGAQPTTATFRFEYERRSDGMLLAKIVPVSVGNTPMDEIRSAIK